MALLTPTWLQNGTYTARLDRIFSDVLLTEGVIRPGAGALLVTQRGAGANNSVDIAAGYAVITGDDTADQGNYLIRNDATVNLAATAAPVSNSRIDLVCVRINDPAAGGPPGDNATFVYITGVAAVSPVPPATPTSAIVLARVLRTVGDTQVVNANITDQRVASLTLLSNTLTNAGDLFSFDGANAVRIPLGSTGLPLVAGVTSPGYAQVGTAGIADTSVTLGKLAANSVDSSKIVDASITGSDIASATVTTSNLSTVAGQPAGAWVAYAPTTTGTVTGTVTARYRQIGKTVDFSITLDWQAGSNFSSLSFTLPVTALAINHALANVSFSDSGFIYPGTASLTAGIVTPLAIGDDSGTGSAYAIGVGLSNTVPFTWGAGDLVHITGRYEAA